MFFIELVLLCSYGRGDWMPPKFKFTKAEITNAALEVTRKIGISGLTARSLALELGCSVKPIFGQFQNMEAVNQAVLEAAGNLYQQYLQTGMTSSKSPPYKASGMAYIRFAKEEKELFKLLFMRDRSGEKIDEEKEKIRPLLDLLQESLGISEENAYLFHLEMWIFVHGIATMAATGYLDWNDEFISKTLTDVYTGLKGRFSERGAEDGCN